MKTKNGNVMKAGTRIGVTLGVLFVVVLIVGINLHTSVETSIMNELRSPTLVVGDADPGDASGFFYFMIYPHAAVPATTYASNLSNATAYEFSDTGNTTAEDETPYSTTFDIVIKAGVTNEDGYYTGNQTRSEGYQWCLATCSELSIGADTNMTEQFIGNSTNYAWYHYYLNNAGSGYTTTEGQYFNVTGVKFYVQRIV